nr:ATP-binding protein [Paenibacillus camelliae]
MAASITHEIRNPMAVVRGYVQLLQERSHVAQREYFSIIIEELDRTNQIISDFLTLAQNKREQKFSNSLNDVINELVPLLQADANLRGQMLVVELSDQLPPYQINESEIKQLLLNISRNGMEAMQQDGVLTIKTMFVNRQIILSIADTGLGIPDELKQKIFEPFYSSKRMGTGLGLPLCANIVHRHNGKISVLNNSQQGTIFQIHFPLEEQLLSS